MANAHILALENLIDKKMETFNVGTGKGSSVLEVIQAFEKACATTLEYHLAPRRSGDVEQVFANPEKIKSQLGWEPQYGLEDALLHSWQWEQTLAEN